MYRVYKFVFATHPAHYASSYRVLRATLSRHRKCEPHAWNDVTRGGEMRSRADRWKESSISISISKSRRFDHMSPPPSFHSRARQGPSILLHPPSRRRRWLGRRDLKNCILYSITKLSRRLVSFYNSKRIHAATRTTAPRSIDPPFGGKQGKEVRGGGRDRGMHVRYALFSPLPSPTPGVLVQTHWRCDFKKFRCRTLYRILSIEFHHPPSSSGANVWQIPKLSHIRQANLAQDFVAPFVVHIQEVSLVRSDCIKI